MSSRHNVIGVPAVMNTFLRMVSFTVIVSHAGKTVASLEAFDDLTPVKSHYAA